MDVHIDEVVRAILVANDENLAGRAPALRFQALEYLTQFQQSNFTLNLTPNSIPPLLTLLHNTSLAIRSAALQAVTRLLETRVQEPSEEVYLLQLVQELSRGTVLTTLEEKTRADQSARRERGEGDEGEESFREALGRCACTLGREIMQILVTNNKEEVNATIGPLFEEILCLSLHFLADQSDNTSLTVFPFLSSFLESLQRANVTEYTLSRRPFLTQLLTVIFEIFSKGKLTLLNTKQPYNDNNAPKIVRKDLIILFELLYSLEPNLVTETTESYGFNILFNDSGNPFLTEYQTFFKETVNPQMQPSPLPSSAIISSDNNKSELLQGLQDLPSLANKDSDGENTIPLSSISIPYPPFPELLSLVNFERKWLRMELASRDEIIQVVDWAIAVSTLAPDYLLEHPGYPLPEQTGPYFFTITRLDPPIQDPLAERIQWHFRSFEDSINKFAEFNLKGSTERMFNRDQPTVCNRKIQADGGIYRFDPKLGSGHPLLVIEICLTQPLEDGRRKALKHMIPPRNHSVPLTDVVLLVSLTKKDNIWSFEAAELWGIDFWTRCKLTEETLLLDSWSSPCKSHLKEEEKEERLNRNFGVARKQLVRIPGYPSVQRPEFFAAMPHKYLALEYQQNVGNVEDQRNAKALLKEMKQAGSKEPEDLGVDLRALMAKSSNLATPSSSTSSNSSRYSVSLSPTEEDNKVNPSPTMIQAKSWDYALNHSAYQWFFVDETTGESDLTGIGAIMCCLGKIDKLDALTAEIALTYGHSFGWYRSAKRDNIMSHYGLEEHQRTEMDKVWATISHQNILDAIAGATKDLQPKLSSKTNSSMMALDINDFLTACLGKICKE